MSDGRSDMDCVTPLELEAHAWVRRIASREATAADARRLRQWCAQSAAHETAFRDARQLWKTFGAAALQVREDEVRAAKHRSARHYVSRRMVLGALSLHRSPASRSFARLCVCGHHLPNWKPIFGPERANSGRLPLPMSHRSR
ncbi:DUF4880 domain-containing protein [Rhodopseudomonas sp. P2A-2r]|uniref:FecR/PupR family sigma factor regulator n=1 Tax=Rhodopseudomonas sp. P2A-2r TaxID=2991972 RepID=UPI002233FF7D|nr:DUF4880 domain-containing protein [Rhodopseudomonas sp. P2A-2r]UZE50954.1 DUF4880 domain-containing protein [Rhodopseudomonas sp. P2A-2r]